MCRSAVEAPGRSDLTIPAGGELRLARLTGMDDVDPLDAITAALGTPGQLISATQVAAGLGVSRDWVYEHAGELGAIRLGSGRKPRLGFDPRLVAQAIQDGFGTRRERRRSRRFRRSSAPADVELLPIAGVGSERSLRGT